MALHLGEQAVLKAAVDAVPEMVSSILFYFDLFQHVLFYSLLFCYFWRLIKLNLILSHLVLSSCILSYHFDASKGLFILRFPHHIRLYYIFTVKHLFRLCPPSLPPSFFYLACYHSPSFSISSTLSIYTLPRHFSTTAPHVCYIVFFTHHTFLFQSSSFPISLFSHCLFQSLSPPFLHPWQVGYFHSLSLSCSLLWQFHFISFLSHFLPFRALSS